MEDGAKECVCRKCFWVSLHLGAGWEKPQRARKKEGEITIEKEFLCLLPLPSQPFQVRFLEQKENQSRLCSHRPRTASVGDPAGHTSISAN